MDISAAGSSRNTVWTSQNWGGVDWDLYSLAKRAAEESTEPDNNETNVARSNRGFTVGKGWDERKHFEMCVCVNAVKSRKVKFGLLHWWPPSDDLEGRSTHTYARTCTRTRTYTHRMSPSLPIPALFHQLLAHNWCVWHTWHLAVLCSRSTVPGYQSSLAVS